MTTTQAPESQNIEDEASPATPPSAPSDSPTVATSASEPATPPAAAEATTPFATKLKHALLKIIDITALGFLEPVVRLCYGEEPQVQLKKPVVLLLFLLSLSAFSWQFGLTWHHFTRPSRAKSPPLM